VPDTQTDAPTAPPPEQPPEPPATDPETTSPVVAGEATAPGPAETGPEVASAAPVEPAPGAPADPPPAPTQDATEAKTAPPVSETTDAPAATPRSQPQSARGKGRADYANDAEYEEALLAYVREQAAVPSNSAADYSKGFSGTKADTDAEKAFGDMMKAGAAGEGRFPVVDCTCTRPEKSKAEEHGDDCTGKWLRTLNQQETCYLYIHTITHQVLGVRPAGFVDPEEEKRKALALLDPFAGFNTLWVRDVSDIAAATAAAWKDGCVLLLLAEEEGDDNIYAKVKEMLVEAEGHHVVDTRPLALGPVRTKVKFPDCVEAARCQLVTAMQTGTTLVIDVHDQAPAFADKICNEPKYKNSFPIQVFDPKASPVSGWFRKPYKPTDGDQVLSPGFRSCIVAALGPGVFEKELSQKIPKWSQVLPVRVKCGVQDVQIPAVPDLIGHIISQGKTPLLLDSSADDLVSTGLAYGHTTVLEAKKMVVQKLQGVPVPEILEYCRTQLVTALKHGNTLLIRLSDACPDLVNTYSAPDLFPAALVLERGGAAVAQREVTELFVRDEDKENGVFAVREGFKVVVVAATTADKVVERLGGALPLHLLRPVTVSTSS